MAVILSLGVLNMVGTEPHGFAFGLLLLAVSLIIICLLTILFPKKSASSWIVLAGYTLLLYMIGGPHLFTFSLLGFTWAFAKIGCLTTDEH